MFQVLAVPLHHHLFKEDTTSNLFNNSCRTGEIFQFDGQQLPYTEISEDLFVHFSKRSSPTDKLVRAALSLLLSYSGDNTRECDTEYANNNIQQGGCWTRTRVKKFDFKFVKGTGS